MNKESKEVEEKKQVHSDIPESIIAKSSDQIRERDEEFISYYANNAVVGMSAWDVAMTFGEHIGDKDGKAVIHESVKILMSREMAKVLNKLLTDQIASYEKAFGAINIPDVAKVRELGKPGRGAKK